MKYAIWEAHDTKVGAELVIPVASGRFRTEVRYSVGEGGLELRNPGFSTVRWCPGNADLSGVSRICLLNRVDHFYPISTRPVEVPVEESGLSDKRLAPNLGERSVCWTRYHRASMAIASTLSEGPKGAPTIVLLHGLGNSREMWADVPSLLTKMFNVVNLDLPGFGKSDRPKDSMGIDAVAADVVEYLDARDLGGAPLVGHSLGGIVALRAARLRATSIPTVLVAGFPADALSVLKSPRRALDKRRVSANLVAQFLGASLPDVFGIRSKLLNSPNVRSGLLRPFMANPAQVDGTLLSEALTGTGSLRNLCLLRLTADVDVESDAHAHDARITLIVGDSDNLHSAADLATFVASGGEREVTVISNCGHWPQLEQPEVLVQAIAQALN